jgi:hypothetical protein
MSLHEHTIFLIAVVRSSDKTVVASYQPVEGITVEGVRECIAGNANIETGKRYTSQGKFQSIHYTVDPQGRAYAMVTSPTYAMRMAFIAIDELIANFSRELGHRIAGATEQSLTGPSLPILKQIYQK